MAVTGGFQLVGSGIWRKMFMYLWDSVWREYFHDGDMVPILLLKLVSPLKQTNLILASSRWYHKYSFR